MDVIYVWIGSRERLSRKISLEDDSAIDIVTAGERLFQSPDECSRNRKWTVADYRMLRPRPYIMPS